MKETSFKFVSNTHRNMYMEYEEIRPCMYTKYDKGQLIKFFLSKKTTC